MNFVRGEFTKLNGKEFYCIKNYDQLDPFLFTLVSAGDIWIYLSSTGGVTAGRVSAEKAFFPYLTDDRLYHSTDTGSKTIVRAKKDGKTYLWEPFTHAPIPTYSVTRNLYKSVVGGEAVFEEINADLGITFRYGWCSSEKFGIIRTVSIEADSDIEVEILDGMLNILPYGIRSSMQLSLPCLADAYKSTEILGDHTVVFSLTSAINDKPTPEEMLRCNVAWAIADFHFDLYLSEKAVTGFINNHLEQSTTFFGDRGCFLLRFNETLKKDTPLSWYTIADVGLTQNDISKIMKGIPLSEVQADLEHSEFALMSIAAKADGLQCTGNRRSTVHHLSNVTFNNMRGGLFMNGYSLVKTDFLGFVQSRSQKMLSDRRDFFEALPPVMTISQLKEKAKETGNPDLIRLCYEYVPISFSRRHGDPSRPWNTFSIVLKDENGNPRTNYEGNWRDIFQNWEAMCQSFPEYIDSVIAIFLDASTADGYNPFRVSRGGIDWEVGDPNDPNCSQGYWGDHQIIYLARLIEWLDRYDTAALSELIEHGAFSYADVPYEIADFADVLKNPKSTITLNFEKNRTLRAVSEKEGSDRRLLCFDGKVYHASFAEKIVVPILAKMANLVIGGGIWMNTERPEWNDANNAIVGYGLSVVTACHLRRHLALCREIFARCSGKTFRITKEVADWLNGIFGVLETYAPHLNGTVDGKMRLAFLSDMGAVTDSYHHVVYEGQFSEKTEYSYDDLCRFLSLALDYVSDTITRNKTEEGFYHSYNLLDRRGDAIEIRHLFPMLEGQVAVLGCSLLSGKEAVALIDTMEKSKLWSERDKSFYLYPIKMSKLFMEKNQLTEAQISSSSLIQKLLADKETSLVLRDSFGAVRFAPDVVGDAAARQVLETLAGDNRYSSLVAQETAQILNIVEEQFHHFEFTGRSQIMYRYEGIGSIYWHQNSKLLVSMQESYLNAIGKESADTVDALKDCYYRIRSGLGFYKEPDVWGAFPQDAYSHTPYGGGAKQPGMTGQVKEEIITRFGELGVIPKNGEITFALDVVAPNELLSSDTTFDFIRQDDSRHQIPLRKGELGFSYCQTPIIYKNGTQEITVRYSDSHEETIKGNTLPQAITKKLISRTGEIDTITVCGNISSDNM